MCALYPSLWSRVVLIRKLSYQICRCSWKQFRDNHSSLIEKNKWSMVPILPTMFKLKIWIFTNDRVDIFLDEILRNVDLWRGKIVVGYFSSEKCEGLKNAKNRKALIFIQGYADSEWPDAKLKSSPKISTKLLKK